MKEVHWVAIKERVLLSRAGSDKKTYHIVLDLKDIHETYRVGGCVGIYPVNSQNAVEACLHQLQLKGQEQILDREGREHTLRAFLTYHADLQRLTIKQLRTFVEKIERGKEEILALFELGKERLKSFTEQWSFLDFLHHFNPSLSAQELVCQLQPLLPRLYSIASSPLAVGAEAHLLVKLTQYEICPITSPKERLGCCSAFLCQEAPLNQKCVPIYLEAHREFTLPLSEKTPIIMVGPGTGVAPFRGFMHERALSNQTCRNWLFFGERRRACDFYYEEFWHNLVRQGLLKLELAFSRDQNEKIYVQNRLREQGAEVWRWLQEGAHFYVCGDATHMAKDVESALLEIISKEGGYTEKDARNYLREMRRAKRYLRDVY